MDNILIYVSESLVRAKEEINKKIEELNISNVITYDDSSDLYKLVEDLNTLSLFESNKAVILTDTDFMKNNIDSASKVFVSYLKDPNPDAYLFIIINKLDELSKDFKEICEKLKVITIKTLDTEDFVSIAKNEFKENKFNVKDNVIKEIVLRSNNDYVMLKNNILKLITYKYESKEIIMPDVELMIVKEEDAKIYELADAITKKDKRRIYDIYTSLINQNITSDKLLNSIIQKYTTLLNVKRLSGATQNDKDICEILNLKDKQVYAIKKQAANFSMSDLKDKLNFFLDLDVSVKTGKINLDKDLLTALLK